MHAYLDVDPRQLLLHLDDVDDLTEFARHIESYIATEKEKPEGKLIEPRCPGSMLDTPADPDDWRLSVRRYRRGRRVVSGRNEVMISQVTGAPERSIRASAVSSAVWCRSAAAT